MIYILNWSSICLGNHFFFLLLLLYFDTRLEAIDLVPEEVMVV